MATKSRTAAGSVDGRTATASDATLTAGDVALFRRAIERLSPIDDAALGACVKLLTVKVLSRGAHLLRAGEPARWGGIVARGLLREYFILSDGSERTKAFVIEGDPTGSLSDLIRGGPSRSDIVAEEPARVLVVPFSEHRALSLSHPAWAAWERREFEMLYMAKAEREYELLALDAEQRYGSFLRRYPGLEARVAAKHVASYLGITPVHLSRLRKRRRAGAYEGFAVTPRPAAARTPRTRPATDTR